MPTKTKDLMNGEDSFGKWVALDNFSMDEPELCIGSPKHPIPGHTPNILIIYNKPPKLPDGITPEDTILESDEGAIGLDCGCYAKFHRQVAHIQTRKQLRDKSIPSASFPTREDLIKEGLEKDNE